MLQSQSVSVGGSGNETTVINAIQAAEGQIANVNQGANFLQTRLWILFGDYWLAVGDIDNAHRCWKQALFTWQVTMSSGDKSSVAELEDFDSDSASLLSTIRYTLDIGTRVIKAQDKNIQGVRELDGSVELITRIENMPQNVTLESLDSVLKENFESKNAVELISQNMWRAQLLSRDKQFDEAKVHAETAIQQITDHFGVYNSAMLKAQLAYRDLLVELEEKELAEKANTFALLLACKIRGYESDEAIKCLCWKAGFAVSNGHAETAKKTSNFIAQLGDDFYRPIEDPRFANCVYLSAMYLIELDAELKRGLISSIRDSSGFRERFDECYHAGSVLSKVGHDCWKAKEFDEAAGFYEWAYRIHVKRFGPDNELTLLSLCNLGINLKLAGEEVKAIRAFEEYLSKKKIGAPFWIIRQLVDLYIKRGNNESAVDVLDKELPLIRSKFSDDKAQLASELVNLGELFCDAGSPKKAEKPLLEVFLCKYKRNFKLVIGRQRM